MVIDTDKLLAWLNQQAKFKQHIADPDFNAWDYSGGNYDDAYALGVDDGYAQCAVHILEKFVS